jgi:AAA+ superfamily predicted ATPase
MKFLNYIQAGFPLLWIKSHEELRILTECSKDLSTAETTTRNENGEDVPDTYKMFSWDVADGIRPISINENNLVQDDAIAETDKDPFLPLTWLDEKADDNTVLFLLDYHSFLKKELYAEHYLLVRKIRNLYSHFKDQGKALVIVSADQSIPLELDKEIALIKYPLPNREELRTVLHDLHVALDTPYPRDDMPAIEASLGLTVLEAENAYSAVWQKSGGFDAPLIMKEKTKVVEKDDILKVVSVPVSVDDIGGNEYLKEWLIERQGDFTDKARLFGVEPPRGLLLVGHPGTGKSLAIKAIASAWNRPCFRLDFGRIFGSYVGESEENISRVMEFAVANAPVVLWIDEIDKGASGNKAGQESHETTRRSFQILLTSMQEIVEDVLFAATANSVISLPPELMRAGRFGTKFFLDFPDDIQREEILKIHLRKRGRDITKYNGDIPRLVAACDTFTGAEIEEWVKESLHRAYFLKHEDLLTEDLLETVGKVLPIAKLDPESIEATRQWVMRHGVMPASKSHPKTIVQQAPVARRIRKVQPSSKE